MGREVFSRYEKKYLLTQEQFEMVSGMVAEHIELDSFNQAHGLYTICNLYYDTEGDELIRKSLSKPLYKEKLRLRAYGVPERTDRAYLEIKKKFKGKVYKRRTPIIIQEADWWVGQNIQPEETGICNQQVLDEISFFISRYDLAPRVYIAYDRLAYGQDDLRITFDTNIRTRRDDLSLEAGDHGRPLLPDGLWLMEVKVSESMPMWLGSLLSAQGLFSQSFSKYGREFLNFLTGIEESSTRYPYTDDPTQYIYRTVPSISLRKGA